LAQYSSKANCLAQAGAFPRDTTGSTASPTTSGNSLECRSYHASVAGYSASDATTHCYHAGNLGGAGQCGTKCAGYCSTVMAACTGTRAQFASTADCLAYCATYPVSGNQMPGTATSGNSVECRSYHASVALGGDNSTRTTHCPHANAVSGSNTCGNACDAYCQTFQTACDGKGAFATLAACQTACAQYSITGASGDTTGNTLQCRQYHAGVALTGSDSARTTHCPHAGATPTEFCIAQVMGSSTGANAAGTIRASIALIAAVIVAALAL